MRTEVLHYFEENDILKGMTQNDQEGLLNALDDIQNKCQELLF